MSPIHTDYHGQDGKAEIVQAASVSLHGPHGQYIENVHLQPYTSDKHFEVLYEGQYSKLLKKAEEFVKGTGGKGDDALVFIRSVDDYSFCDGLYSLSFCPDVPFKKIAVASMHASMNIHPCPDTVAKCPHHFTIVSLLMHVHSRTNTHKVDS